MAAFEAADVGAVEVGAVGELFLRETQAQANAADGRAEEAADICGTGRTGAPRKRGPTIEGGVQG